MNYTRIDKKIFKCDLCGGDPQCARFCEVKAVEYIASENLSAGKKRDAATRFYAAHKKGVAIQA